MLDSYEHTCLDVQFGLGTLGHVRSASVRSPRVFVAARALHVDLPDLVCGLDWADVLALEQRAHVAGPVVHRVLLSTAALRVRNPDCRRCRERLHQSLDFVSGVSRRNSPGAAPAQRLNAVRNAACERYPTC